MTNRMTSPRTMYFSLPPWASLLLLGLLAPLSGCNEFVHMGQISDRESGFAINDARIEQRQDDGGWKRLGDNTDGNGKWWIMKDRIKGGGDIRITKPGYYPMRLAESEFIASVNLMMIPTGAAGPTDDIRGGWGDDTQRRPRRRLD